MAAEKAFIVPVVIDGTRESTALVPDKFRAVQWTRLINQDDTQGLVAQVQRLLVREPQTEPGIRPVETGTAIALGAYGAAGIRGKPSIAVLPFTNMSGDPEQDYFADGMVEDIITALSRFNQLFVIARNSSFTYKGRAVDVRQVATELGVRYVLGGSVRRSENRLRITGQLVDAENGAHLWADKFDGSLDDIFDLQDKITANVVGAIEPSVKKAEIERSRRKPTDNLDAYDLYLRAVPLVESLHPDKNLGAIELLRKAIAPDPNYAPVLASAAWCYEQRITRGWTAVGEDDCGTAVAFARRALGTGADDASALVVAGFVVSLIRRDWDTGLEATRRASNRNPGSGFVSLMANLTATFRQRSPERQKRVWHWLSVRWT
jgi:adenylate cyclase